MKNNGLKIVGIFFGVFLVVQIAVFIAYPYLNEDGFRAVQEQFEEANKDEGSFGDDREFISGEFESLDDRIRSFYEKEEKLEGKLDSLMALNDELRSEIEELKQSNEEMASGSGDGADEAAAEFVAAADEAPENREEFSERVKSLLNLDEEDLGPIVNQLSNDQLVQLYYGAGSIQREKLLRSLNSERAAEIMKKIML
ncbi:MAG: hypothetical protein JJU46_08190 [Balneolaceae bacterium]|nr:hypothetical protein [Balneolaceae bacterium]MCH8547904.1 hypothetical protein [Balneolaceae bacterium]